MTGKRYFKEIWEDEYYIFDSDIISKREFDEKVEYEDYQAFADSMSGDDVVNRLNGLDGTVKDLSDDYEQLLKKNKELKELINEVNNELEIRDTVCGAGKFRLEEWGKHRYHQFYKGDKELEDESVVIMLMELEKENEELKKENDELKRVLQNTSYQRDEFLRGARENANRVGKLKKENEQLKSEIEKLSYANEDLLSEKRNWQRMSDEYCKLSEENERLKQQIQDMQIRFKRKYDYEFDEIVDELEWYNG